MADNDFFWGAGIGALTGALVGSMSQEDKKLFEIFKQNRYEFEEFLRLRKEFKYFENNKNNFNDYIKLRRQQEQKFNEFPKIEIAIHDKHIKGAMGELFICYANGAYKASIVTAFSIIEYMVRKYIFNKSSNEKISTLLERAFNQQIFSLDHYNFLKGVSVVRNNHAHDLSIPATEHDAKIIILILLKTINSSMKSGK